MTNNRNKQSWPQYTVFRAQDVDWELIVDVNGEQVMLISEPETIDTVWEKQSTFT